MTGDGCGGEGKTGPPLAWGPRKGGDDLEETCRKGSMQGTWA